VTPFLEEAGLTVDRELLLRVVPLIQERIRTLAEAVEMAGFFFVEGPLDYAAQQLLGKRFAGAPEQARAALAAVIERVEALQAWDEGSLEAAVRPLAEDLGLKAGDLFGIIRVAITGRTAAPPLFDSMAVLGRKRTLERLRAAVEKIGTKS
jgi:glutamyl-tRNA synthetase